MPARTANARWEGGLKDGKGNMRLGGGAFEGQYSFSSRFEEGVGTNPEELIAAAHAGCFSMAFSGALEKAGFSPNSVETEAKVHLSPADGGGFRISRIDLVTNADVPGIEDGAFQQAAQAAKEGCPVSKALAAVEITVNATLAG
ncbi:MAG TPA: OsmC family protein [Acidimicrobiia bacterium]|jgi:lipoyl-dependent peroxiredoxin|nr:OsmC family protein [Acidimicrobiia bacterium]